MNPSQGDNEQRGEYQGEGEPAPIDPDDLLATADLVSEDELWSTPRSGRLIRDSGVSIGRPLLYPVTEEDLPDRVRKRSLAADRQYFGMLLAFDLEPLPADQSYAKARFAVRIFDDRVVAVGLEEDDVPAADLATRSRPGLLERFLGGGAPRAVPWGRQSPAFGWTYAGTPGNGLTRHNFAMNALLEAPAGVAEVAGAFDVQASIRRSVLGYASTHVSGVRGELRFTEPLASRGSRGGAGDARTRLCLAVDMERYSRHRNDAAKRAQERLARVVEHALAQTGADRARTEVQEQGDGMLVLFPEVDESRVIPALADGFRGGLAEVNQDLREDSRVRLRCVLERGLVERADCGWVGAAVIYASRILDSQPAKEALTRYPRSDFVLAVSEALYMDVIAQGYGGLDPEQFWRAKAEIPQKNFSQSAWLYVPRR